MYFPLKWEITASHFSVDSILLEIQTQLVRNGHMTWAPTRIKPRHCYVVLIDKLVYLANAMGNHVKSQFQAKAKAEDSIFFTGSAGRWWRALQVKYVHYQDGMCTIHFTTCHVI